MQRADGSCQVRPWPAEQLAGLGVPRPLARPPPAAGPGGSLVLTGATGFVGSHFLFRLLAQDDPPTVRMRKKHKGQKQRNRNKDKQPMVLGVAKIPYVDVPCSLCLLSMSE